MLKEILKKVENGENQYNEIFSYVYDNLKEAISFIETSTDLEFYNMQEVFVPVARLTQNKDFVEALKSRFIKMSDVSLDLFELQNSILDAEYELPEEEI